MLVVSGLLGRKCFGHCRGRRGLLEIVDLGGTFLIRVSNWYEMYVTRVDRKEEDTRDVGESLLFTLGGLGRYYLILANTRKQLDRH